MYGTMPESLLLTFDPGCLPHFRHISPGFFVVFRDSQSIFFLLLPWYRSFENNKNFEIHQNFDTFLQFAVLKKVFLTSLTFPRLLI